jgi:hypothetical protein
MICGHLIDPDDPDGGSGKPPMPTDSIVWMVGLDAGLCQVSSVPGSGPGLESISGSAFREHGQN